MEVKDSRLQRWLEEADVPASSIAEPGLYRPDAVAAAAGRTAITYLSQISTERDRVDRLTVEALALAIVARGLTMLTPLDGGSAHLDSPWLKPTQRSAIDRAIDYLEAHLCDPILLITAIAEAANFSSSHFATVFKRAMGETPYAVILRRRAEHARDLIVGTRESLAQIAYAAGFSSQAHMTVVMRQTFGATPATFR